jgi:hypothetical protein
LDGSIKSKATNEREERTERGREREEREREERESEREERGREERKEREEREERGREDAETFMCTHICFYRVFPTCHSVTFVMILLQTHLFHLFFCKKITDIFSQNSKDAEKRRKDVVCNSADQQ